LLDSLLQERVWQKRGWLRLMGERSDFANWGEK